MTEHDTTPPRLGYDPLPDVHIWQGNALPPVDDPLSWSPMRERIAGRVFWQGPSWNILRNSVHYLHRVMDYGKMFDAVYTFLDVDRTMWLRALDEARPGSVSRRAFFLWSRIFARDPTESPHDWMASRHVHDQYPREGITREAMLDIAARAHFDHEARACAPTVPVGAD